MHPEKANEITELVTHIAGCVSTIQLIDAGVVPQFDDLGRADYVETLERHQDILRNLLLSL